MGQRGPHKLRIVNGDAPEPGEVVTIADTVELGAPEPPAGMTPGEVKLWDRLVPLLDLQGLVTPVDALTLDLMLRHYLAAVQAADELAEAAAVALDDPAHKGRLQKHPADAVFRLHSAAYLGYAQQTGMTFAARARMNGKAAADDGDENPFAPPATAAGGS